MSTKDCPVKTALPAKSIKVRGARLFSAQLDNDQAHFDGAPLLCEIFDWMESLEDDSRVSKTLNNEQLVLVETLKTLSASETAYALFEEAMEYGWSVDTADLDSHDYHIDVPELKITLNSHGLNGRSLLQSKYFRSSLVISLARALRDIWQEERHGGFEDHYKPEDILLLERIRNADCEAVMALCAWEIDCAGDTGIWRHLIASSEGDVALAFKTALPMRGADYPNDSLAAMGAAFVQWFSSEDRLNVCDHETLEYLDALMVDQEFEGFSDIPLNAEYIETLSCLPNHLSYLGDGTTDVLHNPIYSAVNDIINNSHLMHIVQDLETTQINGIMFRDSALASKIFPESMVKTSIHA